MPWKPHAALRLTIANAGACNPQWKLQQFGKLAGDVSEAVWPEVTAAPPCIMGSEGQDNSSCSLSRWAKAMEVCRGNVQGRGQDVNKVWGALQETRCMKASTSTPAGWWGRMRVHTNQWETSKGDATQVDVFLLKHVVRPEQEAFKAKVCDAFAQRQVGQLQTLREWSEAQKSEAQVAASRESHQNFKRWLQVGMAKGMRPLFSSLSKAESVFVRPLLTSQSRKEPDSTESSGPNFGRKRQWGFALETTSIRKLSIASYPPLKVNRSEKFPRQWPTKPVVSMV